jgi:putative DNA primase/helicase
MTTPRRETGAANSRGAVTDIVPHIPKPRALPVDPNNIPPELRDRPQWVVWQYQWSTDREEWAKIPLQAAPLLSPTPTPRRAAANRPHTWGTFADALAAYRMHPPMGGEVLPPTDLDSTGNGGLDGIGFVFTEDDPLCGVDIDDCLDPQTGEIAAHAADIVGQLTSYTELSASGTGLHTIVHATLGGLEGRRRGNVEMYDRGRFFAVTGHRCGGVAGVQRRQHEIEAVHRLYVARPTPPAHTTTPRAAPTIPLGDAALLERMFASNRGADIRRLWEGDTSAYNGDASAADLALASHLVWWCDYDTARADALFRRSALFRPKWDEKHSADGRTYGQMTLARASEGKGPGDGYRPPHTGCVSKMVGCKVRNEQSQGSLESGVAGDV